MLHPLAGPSLLLCALPAFAWNPPTDTAGPLTVRLEGPAEVTRVDVPHPVRVQLENRGETLLRGTVRLAVIDRWKTEPAKEVPFQVAPRGTARLDFTITAGTGTHSAHYPVHAYAALTVGGERLVAHPVLILETKLPHKPRAPADAAWTPADIPPDSATALWRLPAHRAVVLPFRGDPIAMPPGWTGSEEGTRATYQRTGGSARDGFREGLTVHPPWSGGRPGTLVAEVPLRLPAQGPIRLRFAGAVRVSGPDEPQGDGITCRVRAVPLDAPDGRLGTPLFERHIDTRTWTAAEADLSSLAGKSVRLQLESHPGPKNNTTCDSGWWGEPTLIAGTPPPPPRFPPPADASPKRIGTLDRPGGPVEVCLHPGRRGLLDAAIGFTTKTRTLWFHGFEARVLGNALEDPRSPAVLLEAKAESATPLRIRHRFRSGAGTFDLVGELRCEGGALRAAFRLENAPATRPWRVATIEDLAAGPWNARASRIYAGAGNVIRKPEALDLNFDGHRLSTSFVGLDFLGGLSIVQGVDVPPDRLVVHPATGRATLHVSHAPTLTFIPGPDVWSGAQTWHDVNGLQAAGGVRKLAGRFVFDLWGGRYGASADALRRAFRYGLTDACVVWHNWQRWGYDYRLPDIWPPNPKMGTLAEFQTLAKACRDAGVLFAPHDNYIDYYPDADGYTYDKIAFTPDGRPVRAWINKGRNAQSYRWITDRIRPVLEKNVRLIKDGCAPTAFFIDVWSSIGPYDSWTHDGRFIDCVATRTAWGEMFAWIRDTLGDDAPQISESGHDQLIGWLDGAQTNHLRVDRPRPGRHTWSVWNIRCADAERVPWFDAAHHDRFVLHGAGYEGRYVSGLDRRLHGIYSDDYITTEILAGHPAMVPVPFGREVVRKYWLLHEPMRALALRRIESVAFEDNIHRQTVRWEGGGTVRVNRGKDDWTVAGRTLPPYGCHATIPGPGGPVEAAIERRDGVIVDWCRSPARLFVNARPMAGDRVPVKVVVGSVRPLGNRSFELALKWEAAAPLPDAMNIFVHFTDAAGEIRFQGDHRPPTPTTAWRGTIHSTARVTIPAGVSSPSEIRVGLWGPGGGRAALEGMDDGERRIRLGTVAPRADGSVVFSPLDAPADPLLARTNAARKKVAFPGGVTTNGALRLDVVNGALRATLLPSSPPFTLRLTWVELPWRLPEPTRAEALDEAGKTVKTTMLTRESGAIVLNGDAGVFAYRLK
jgi:hypothetical protein